MFDQVRIGREASAEKKIVFSTSTKRRRHEIVCLQLSICFQLCFRLVSGDCTRTLCMSRDGRFFLVWSQYAKLCIRVCDALEKKAKMVLPHNCRSWNPYTPKRKSNKLSFLNQTNILFRTWRKTEDFDYFHIFIIELLWNQIIVWHFVELANPFFWRTRFRIHRYVTALSRPNYRRNIHWKL